MVEESLPEYPGYTAAFGRIMRSLRGVEPQTMVRATQPEVSDLMKVKDDELVLLRRLAVDAHVYGAGAVEIEIARRNIVATNESTRAIINLQDSTDKLQEVTEAASSSTTEALEQLQNSIEHLRNTTANAVNQSTAAITKLQEANEAWSRWLTRLTIGLLLFTILLVVFAILQRSG